MRLGRRLVWWAGFVLIALGIGALVWSHQLSLAPNPPKNEWWQGTWQALGVGLVVGGLVDVLAISGLNRVTVAEDQRRQRLNRMLRKLLDDMNESQEPLGPDSDVVKFLAANWKSLDDFYSAMLETIGHARATELADLVMSRLVSQNPVRGGKEP
jgi:uncharacterized membrane-anchored protein YhcB (DUF1043 family)